MIREAIDSTIAEPFHEICKRLEHWETPTWAVEEILKREVMTHLVLDPCCGTGVLTIAARAAGYVVTACDVHDWGFPGTHLNDFLAPNDVPEMRPFSVLMNPPFSKAEDFVRRAFEIGARKVVCFQRFAWWESEGRKGFWDEYPPNRIYICGSRATCWLHSIPKNERDFRPDGSKRSGTSAAHAWFVFEPGQPAGTVMGHIYKQGGGYGKKGKAETD